MECLIYSRIEYIFISKSLAPLLVKVGFTPILTADYAPNIPRKTPKIWKLSSSMVTNPQIIELKKILRFLFMKQMLKMM